MFQQTRRQLALGYTAVMAAILILFGYSLFTFLQTTLIQGVDRDLLLVAQRVKRSLPVQHKDGQWQVLASGLRPTPAGLVVTWLPAKTPKVPQTVDFTTQSSQRQLILPWDYEGQRLGYLRVRQSLTEVEEALAQLTWLLGFGIPLTILVIGGSGWVLAGVAIAPIRASYQQLQQFTADASHELRTPIAAIQTNAQVLLADEQTSIQHYRRGLEVIERMTLRMGNLVGDLLLLTRSGGQQPHRSQMLNLGKLLLQLYEEQLPVAQRYGHHLELVVELNSQVYGDPEALARLFLNLITNAFTHTPEGGQVQIYVTREGREVRVMVKDTGIGIAPKEQKAIFERFYRVDSARSRRATTGAGLGLAIARTIAHNHQGEISLVSTLGIGSCFVVHLPWRGDAKVPERGKLQ